MKKLFEIIKKIVFVSILAIIFLNACKNKDKKESTTTEQTETVSGKEKSEATAITSGFDIDKIPTTNKEIGPFHHLTPPEGYKYQYENNKKYEEKNFYYNDSLVTKIGSKYFFSTIWKKDDNKDEY